MKRALLLTLALAGCDAPPPRPPDSGWLRAIEARRVLVDSTYGVVCYRYAGDGFSCVKAF